MMAYPDRRSFIRGSAAAGSLALLGGCATTTAPPPVGFRKAPALAPILARPDRIMSITVCSRPFRPAGPRLDAERIGDKLVVHNYGHGGSGWSLSWGSALIAVGKAMAAGPTDIAVIGCGALGLTAAITAQRAGAKVTIYAREQMAETRSARATGMWSPDSRIALRSAVGPQFDVLWEEMARSSFHIHQRYLGLADEPVTWTERYSLWDGPRRGIPDPIGFATYGGRLNDLTPAGEPVEPGAHPFAQASVRRVTIPIFNITEYGRVLTSDFLLAGGRMERREFNTASELGTLKEKVIINCTGYGARALFRDETLVPVRGQIAWLIPQPEVTYGLYYEGVSTLSRRDGIAVQRLGPDEGYGYNDPSEAPDRADAEAAVKTIAQVFAPAGNRAAAA